MLLNKQGIKSRNIPLMYIIDFLSGCLFFLPFLALYFEQSLYSAKNVAIIFAVEALSVAVLEVPTGAWSDIFGRKKIMIAAFASLFLAVCLLLIGGSMIMFIAYAVLNGLTMALTSGNSQSLIYDSLKEEGREECYKKIIGTFYALWPLGATVSALVGGYLVNISVRTTVFYSLFPITLAFVLTFFLKEPAYHKSGQSTYNHIGSSLREIIKNKQLLLLLVGWLLLMAVGESLHNLKPLFLQFKDVPIVYFGYVTALIFGLSSFSHYIGHYVSEKFGNKNTLLFCLVLSPLVSLCAALTHKYVAAILLATPSIFFGIRNVVIDYLFNKKIPSSHRATINSINSLTSRIGIAIVMPFIGYLADLYTINTAYIVGAGILFFVSFLFIFVKTE